jgi:hypothetical protein
MFHTIYHTASVTLNNVLFGCPETTNKHLSDKVITVSLATNDVEAEIAVIRHFNRIQKSTSKKTRGEIENNKTCKFYRNFRENCTRSKERRQQLAYAS